MADVKRPTVEELRREWSGIIEKHHEGRDHGIGYPLGCSVCALRAALDLLAEAQRRIEMVSLDRDLHRAEHEKLRPLLAEAQQLSDGLRAAHDHQCARAVIAERALAEAQRELAHRKAHSIEDGIQQDPDGVTYCPTCGDLKGWKPPLTAAKEKP